MASERLEGTGSRVAETGVRSRGETTIQLGKTAAAEAIPYRSADAPAVLKETTSDVSHEDMLETSYALARRARDAFSEACSALSSDEGETSFLAAKQKLGELRSYIHLRDRPFRDLVALLTAAIKLTDLSQIENGQKIAIQDAFSDLPRSFLDDRAIERHIERFAECGIDQVIYPVLEPAGKRFKITLEEIA